MTRQIAARRAADGADPFVLRKGSDIPAAIHALELDQNVVANAYAAAFGWHAPDGVTLDLDEDMYAPGLMALRAQSEGRLHRAAGTARVEILRPGADSDQRIAQVLAGKARDPFFDATPHAPELDGS
jgi:hypothetical protein